jgi:hypothetical protein
LHKLTNTELTSDFGIMSLARVMMLPPNGKIRHENIIGLDPDLNPGVPIAVQAC